MILEIIRNVLAFNLVLSDCLQAYSTFHLLKNPYFIKAYRLYADYMHNLIPETR